MATSSGLTGSAGEHYAAAELHRRGFLVTLTRGNAPGIDILAYHPDTKKTIAIQVKASDGHKKPAGQWILSLKDEDEGAVRSDFFIFVHMPRDFAPAEFTIVPSRDVARKILKEFNDWAATPGHKGQQRDATNRIRMFFDKTGEWRNRWDLILSKAGVKLNRV